MVDFFQFERRSDVNGFQSSVHANTQESERRSFFCFQYTRQSDFAHTSVFVETNFDHAKRFRSKPRANIQQFVVLDWKQFHVFAATRTFVYVLAQTVFQKMTSKTQAATVLQMPPHPPVDLILDVRPFFKHVHVHAIRLGDFAFVTPVKSCVFQFRFGQKVQFNCLHRRTNFQNRYRFQSLRVQDSNEERLELQC